MGHMQSFYSDIQLLHPDVERDAAFALSWFTRPEGKDTLLSMGNAESEIETPTLEGQCAIMREFLDLEKNNQQITRAISIANKTIGFVWVELIENHGVMPPSVHIMIGDPEYRGKGLGKAAMQAAIEYVRDELKYRTIYSRHLVSNDAIAHLTKSLGFENDGMPYTDDNGLVWQNIKLHVQ